MAEAATGPAGRPLLIGVSARIHHPQAPGLNIGGVYAKTLHYLEQSVAHWLLSGHAMPVMVPAVTKDSLLRRSELHLGDYAAALDGLLLQGGNDVAPEHYGETPLHPDWAGDPVRDRYEMELVQAFIDAGKPVFGICRGLQLINVMHGGSLYQDLPTQLSPCGDHRSLARYEHHFHRIEITPGTRLAQLYPGLERAVTNSIHHQGIKTLAPGFVVEARCPDDGLVEAIRREPAAGGFVAAVQWHPEFHDAGSPDNFDDRALLQDFLRAAHAARAGCG